MSIDRLSVFMIGVERYTEKKDYELKSLKKEHAECMDYKESKRIMKAKLRNRQELNEFRVIIRDQMIYYSKFGDDKFIAAIEELNTVIV